MGCLQAAKSANLSLVERNVKDEVHAVWRLCDDEVTLLAGRERVGGRPDPDLQVGEAPFSAWIER